MTILVEFIKLTPLTQHKCIAFRRLDHPYSRQEAAHFQLGRVRAFPESLILFVISGSRLRVCSYNKSQYNIVEQDIDLYYTIASHCGSAQIIILIYVSVTHTLSGIYSFKAPMII